MFGSEILDIILGLSFLYVLLSLLATTVNELLMALLDARGKTLRLALEVMLDDYEGLSGTWWLTSLDRLFSFKRQRRRLRQGFRFMLRKTAPGAEPPEAPPPGLSNALLGHPHLKRLRKPGSTRCPSYLSAGTFARALTDLLASRGFGDTSAEKVREYLHAVRDAPDTPDRPCDDTIRILLGLLDEAGDSLPAFREAVARWYDDVMARASGWYKRKTQIAIFLIGLASAVLLNADTVRMAQTLANDPQARAQVVEMALAYADARRDEAPASGIDSLYTRLQTLVEAQIEPAGVVLGLGWDGRDRPAVQGAWYTDGAWWSWFGVKLAGWLLTAFAVSLGAPFWFDVLSKITRLRNAGHPGGETTAPSTPAG